MKLKEGYYLIGEVSKITGISKDTLHFYNKIGLLTPDYTDKKNQYRYYSRWNLWQLDIITTCRKLSVPLEKVKQLLNFHDNAKITQLLLDYRNEALRLSAYYQQVADDILWYDQENRRISSGVNLADVQMKWLDEETVIAGVLKRDVSSYHANLQEAAKDELQYVSTIQRKYGYLIDQDQMVDGRVCKYREYLKIADSSYSHVQSENLYVLPAGDYAVCIVRIIKDTADFQPLIQWMNVNGYTTDEVYAEELGLQLFDYIDDYYCEIKAHLVKK
ncbi:MerR family transcriptional regulator [Robinsoniella sp. KNHs210]|uniref:MerR family transcriptional regulator n=1 Tax=Robinsoniella sp. KNHs210 TaxID=1469950 RepID=UPI001FA7AB2F|nr:MerR family transcriptional regulator [Robinsoniella sp. KNHs210]